MNFNKTKLFKASLLMLTFVAFLGFTGTASASHLKTVNQHRNALSNFSYNYNFTKNHNYNYDKANWHASYQIDNGNKGLYDHVNYWHGNEHVNFKTYAILNSSDGYGDGNPQSIAIDRHHNAYITYGVGTNRIRLDKYNLNDVHNHTLNPVKEGPVFTSGHGQGLAYNYKTNQLWLLEGDTNRPGVEEISKTSLKPVRQIKFNFTQLYVPNNLTFDKHGNAYMAERTASGRAPVGSLKLFKGKITNHSVHFKLMRKGLRYSPGAIIQNLGYNPRNNRVYVIADEGIISVPANKFGNARPSQVKGTRFHGKREFEGLAFYHRHGYLLMNRGVKLMISNHTL